MLDYYKSLCVTVMICAALVNTQTHTQTHRQTDSCKTISSDSKAKNEKTYSSQFTPNCSLVSAFGVSGKQFVFRVLRENFLDSNAILF